MERHVLKPLCLLCGGNNEKWAWDPPSVGFRMKNVCWHCAPEETSKINFLVPGGTFGSVWAPFWGTLLAHQKPQGGAQKWSIFKSIFLGVRGATPIIGGVTFGPKWSLGGRGVKQLNKRNAYYLTRPGPKARRIICASGPPAGALFIKQ